MATECGGCCLRVVCSGSEQAIEAFEHVLALGDAVPAADQQNAREALNRARYRLEQGKDALDMPDVRHRSFRSWNHAFSPRLCSLLAHALRGR